MRQLEYLLRGIPENEKYDALAYYNDYFDEAGIENEYQVIQELGSPEQVAEKILAECQSQMYGEHQDYGSPEMEYGESFTYSDQTKKSYGLQNMVAEKTAGMSKSTKILLILLIIFLFPLWISLLGGLFGVVVGVLGAVFGVVVGFGGAAIGLFAGGVGLFAGGMIKVFVAPVEGLVTIAVGSILIAISLLFATFIAKLVIDWIPALVRGLINWAKGFKKSKNGGFEI
jgi:uncharacterized membrane protein